MNAYDDDDEYGDDYFLKIQAQINSLVGWRFEGSVGRAMMDAIKAGRCCLGFDPTQDYYGNRIPSRTEVQDGSLGSLGAVVKAHGQDWADQIAAVPAQSALQVFSRGFSPA